jgi:putative (di)nucleoside polyphosphate hydrolase
MSTNTNIRISLGGQAVAAGGGNAGMSTPPAVSCGTLIVNPAGQLLLCHVTNSASWDIPKGMQDPGETRLGAAMRELREEAGLEFGAERFEDLGCFDYRRDKRLHLFRVPVGDELDSLDHLVCTSFFPHPVTGQPTPEADAFRWAWRAEIGALCWPRMAQRLLLLDW